ISGRFPFLEQSQGIGAGLKRPALKKRSSWRREMRAIEPLDNRKVRWIEPLNLGVRRPLRNALKTNVLMSELESASLVKRDHREYTVHSNGSSRRQASLQTFKPIHPQLSAETFATQVASDNEQSHEAEALVVREYCSAPHQIVGFAQRDKRVAIGIP